MAKSVRDLSWLRTEGYSEVASLKLVGDRFSLDSRQRNAIRRSSCSDQSLEIRQKNEVDSKQTGGKVLRIDGFNILTTIESALSGAVIIIGRDGVYRDIASLHGTFRKVLETKPAIELIADAVKSLPVENCIWHFDKPVSNSGQISKLVREVGDEKGVKWETILEHDPDPTLAKSLDVIATADSVILDQCREWIGMAKLTIDLAGIEFWKVDFEAAQKRAFEG